MLGHVCLDLAHLGEVLTHLSEVRAHMGVYERGLSQFERGLGLNGTNLAKPRLTRHKHSQHILNIA